MNRTIKCTLVLTIITLCSGLLLGTVYEVTKEPIAVQQEKTKQNAYKMVFPNADSFTDIEFDKEEAAAIIKNEGYEQSTIDGVTEAMDQGGKLLGYVLTITSKEGYGGDITFTIGIGLDQTVYGIEMLTISETAGLGMKADQAEFKDQFSDKNVSSFVIGSGGAENEIDAISGATITTEAVMNSVNAGIYYFQQLTGGGLDE